MSWKQIHQQWGWSVSSFSPIRIPVESSCTYAKSICGEGCPGELPFLFCPFDPLPLPLLGGVGSALIFLAFRCSCWKARSSDAVTKRILCSDASRFNDAQNVTSGSLMWERIWSCGIAARTDLVLASTASDGTPRLLSACEIVVTKSFFAPPGSGETRKVMVSFRGVSLIVRSGSTNLWFKVTCKVCAFNERAKKNELPSSSKVKLPGNLAWNAWTLKGDRTHLWKGPSSETGTEGNLQLPTCRL